MDSIVEVETAGITARATAIVVVAVERTFFTPVNLFVSTSAVAPSIGGCSISAVAPDYSNGKELALAGA